MAKTTVITAWGKGTTVEKIAFSRFKNDKEGFQESTMAETYCTMVASISSGGESWVNALIVGEGETLNLEKLLPRPDLWTLLPLFDDRAVQKILRETDSNVLTKALKISTPELREKFFKNMSARAAAMIQEDLEYMGPIRAKDAEEAKQKIISIAEHLEETGEIVLPHEDEEVVL
jgi:hypothetical protein